MMMFSYDSVLVFVSDGARYMSKYCEYLKVIFSDDGEVLHVQCWAHKLCIVGNIWPKIWLNLTQQLQCFKTLGNAIITPSSDGKIARWHQENYPVSCACTHSVEQLVQVCVVCVTYKVKCKTHQKKGLNTSVLSPIQK
ncbi:hypothetical protein PR048_009427 [Dryococelus australis]|uniref:Uncharacterized protein n=1 Tax=Dryococelus australis TaxID=614101 RepID=A0ABQ9HZU8_9NEOP|nr:hypothetical protein PR048_009427 [Dryococelus australis]